ncbi:CrcB family protein [Arthrobacter sp. TMP15]|uniref:fluoride efflux transporter FluC n=1 Tax=Arthrobacter sp. TMP15 TaxID=3140789 RepID=UPI0031BB275F
MKIPYLDVRTLSVVAVGGTLGAGARQALVLAVPDAGPLPVSIIVANIVGAFLLGLLYAILNRQDALNNRPHSSNDAEGYPPSNSSRNALERNRRLRLLLGTGFCGGFTTYSALAVGVVLIAGGSSSGGSAWAWAAAYGLGTVFTGVLATWAGIALGTCSERVGTFSERVGHDTPEKPRIQRESQP